jgi:hypothetical protein
VLLLEALLLSQGARSYLLENLGKVRKENLECRAFVSKGAQGFLRVKLSGLAETRRKFAKISSAAINAGV